MDDDMTLFNGLLWLIFTLGFTAYYIITFSRQGITLFGYYVMFSFFLPVCVMYPFAFDVHNIFSVGDVNIDKIIAHANEARFLTFLGMGLMIAGYVASHLSFHDDFARRFSSVAYEGIMSPWQTDAGLAVSVAATAMATLVLLGLGFTFLGGRQFAMENIELRPLYNAWAVLVYLFSINAFVAGMKRQSLSPFLLGIALCFVGLLGGSRSASVAPAMIAFLIYAMATCLRRAAVIGWVGAGFLALALMVGFLRVDALSGNDTTQTTEMWIDSLLYGNNFSDLRDYAWILSGFDGEFYYGKTYLAGFLGFVPSSLFDFRTQYGFGHISTALAGLDGLHGGLRPTQFGEVYLNFGIPGLLVVCPLFGVVAERLNHWTHRNIICNREMNPYVVAMTGVVVMSMVSRTVFTPGFYFNYVILTLWILGFVITSIGRRRLSSSLQQRTMR